MTTIIEAYFLGYGAKTRGVKNAHGITTPASDPLLKLSGNMEIDRPVLKSWVDGLEVYDCHNGR